MKKIVILGTDCDSTNIIYNQIIKQFYIEKVILEKKENKMIFFKRRIKMQGIFAVLGQIAFILFVSKPLFYCSKKRIRQIVSTNNLNLGKIPSNKLLLVDSVNNEKTRQLLKRLNPDLVILSGTRIVSQKTLNAVNCKFINIHAGITPEYRGVHGAYWALVNNDKKNMGVTVHFVDKGIDTGNIIFQELIVPTKEDNFVTYPYLQLATAMNSLNKYIEKCLNNNIISYSKNRPGRLWYHPTLWQYLFYFIKMGIK